MIRSPSVPSRLTAGTASVAGCDAAWRQHGRREREAAEGRRAVAWAAGLALAGVVAFGAGAATADATLWDTPAYFPGNKNHYELVRAQPGQSIRGSRIAEISWNRAAQAAQQRHYRGARGRLAVVKSPELNDWLRTTFRPRQMVWIGLRYWCKLNTLQWVTGEIYPRTEYANWDPVWAGTGGYLPDCRNQSWFWPVHYWGIDRGFRWHANGMIKEAHGYFVEYPTGERPEKPAKSEPAAN